MSYHSKKESTALYILLGVLTLLVLSLLFSGDSFAHSGPYACFGEHHYHSTQFETDTKDASNAVCPGNIGYTLSQATSVTLSFANLVNIITGIVVSLAFLYFFWNLAKYIRDEEEHEEAKKRMGWSVLAIIVITSLWGIVSFVRNIVGIDGQERAGAITLPSTQKHDGSSVFELIDSEDDRYSDRDRYDDRSNYNRGRNTGNSSNKDCSQFETEEIDWCSPNAQCQSLLKVAGYQTFNGRGSCEEVEKGLNCTLCRQGTLCHLRPGDEGCRASRNGIWDYNT